MGAVVAQGITKAFGRGEARTAVLRGADFRAEEGELTFLVGPSGCGKTTLISILAAMLRPDEGRARVFGTDLSGLSGRRLTAFRGGTVGFIFQQFNLLPALDAADNAAVPLIVRGERPARARRRAVEMLDRLGLAGSAAKRPAQMSGGQQQRVAIARALIHEPRLVVCDEPTASLDAATGRTVMGFLRDLVREPGRAAIVVTHDERTFPFADRIAFMADGVVTHTALPPFEEKHP